MTHKTEPMTLEPVCPQPTYIESVCRWEWPLPERAQFDGCCRSVFTASREWWEYTPSEARPHPMAEGVQLRDGKWYWAIPKAIDAELAKQRSVETEDAIVKRLAPVRCPITRREYFMAIEHPERGWVATYGGPFDSFTIPEPDEDGSFRSERFDHDAGDWVEGGNPEPFELVAEHDFNEMFDAREKLSSLAKQREAEPIAYCDPTDPSNATAFAWPGTARDVSRHTETLYTHPQQRNAVEVTDEMVEIAYKAFNDCYHASSEWSVACRKQLRAALSAVASRDREDAERIVIPKLRDLSLCVTEYQQTLDEGYNMAVREMMAANTAPRRVTELIDQARANLRCFNMSIEAVDELQAIFNLTLGRRVGDADFEGWFSTHYTVEKGTKQLAREAYEAGMFDERLHPAAINWYFVATGAGAPPVVIPCTTEQDLDKAIRQAMMGEPDAKCLNDWGDDMVHGIITDLVNVEHHALEDGDFYLVPVKSNG